VPDRHGHGARADNQRAGKKFLSAGDTYWANVGTRSCPRRSGGTAATPSVITWDEDDFLERASRGTAAAGGSTWAAVTWHRGDHEQDQNHPIQDSTPYNNTRVPASKMISGCRCIAKRVHAATGCCRGSPLVSAQGTNGTRHLTGRFPPRWREAGPSRSTSQPEEYACGGKLGRARRQMAL